MEQDLRAKIIAKAWKDEAFRKKLLTNPHAALKELGIDLPEDIDMKVLTEDPKHAFFILPSTPSEVKRFSEAELEKMAASGNLPTPLGDPFFCFTGLEKCRIF